MTQRVWIPSPNYSSRAGSSVRLVVVHCTEGAQDIYSLGSFFAQSSAGVSSHVGTDNNSASIVGEYVKRGNKAWTQGNANPVAVSCEMCTPSGASAGWSRSYWLNNRSVMIDATARWVAEECQYYGLPIVALTPGQAQGSGRGVCQHKDLGAWGGGHVDCGSFPMDELIARAQVFAGQAPAPEPIPEPETEVDDMPVVLPKSAATYSVEISLNGAHASMGMCTDAGTYPASTGVRAAFHIGQDNWHVANVWSDPAHEKVVYRPPAKFDGVRLDRLDDNPCALVVNFA